MQSKSSTQPDLQISEPEKQNFGNAQIQAIEPALLKNARARLEFLYAEVAKSWPGFIPRPGQYQMMNEALLTFLCAKAHDDKARSGNNLAQLEAGTGTGKTVAYCLAAIVASEFLKKTVIVSTATVALQEQLFQKDLPRLREIIPELRFDILKGRGRYICESRLDSAIHGKNQDSLDDQMYLEPLDIRNDKHSMPRDTTKEMKWFKKVSKQLHTGNWDGDSDNLELPPDPQAWSQVQANGNACSGHKCQYFKSCAFFKARRQAATATLQVANHALILATMAFESALIDPGDTLFVFDEAHHLPAIATDQFTYRVKLGNSVKLLSNLRFIVPRHGREVPASIRPDPVAFAQSITQCTEKLALLENYWVQGNLVNAENPIYRFRQGNIPEVLANECSQLAIIIQSLSKVVSIVSEALQEEDESKSPQKRDEHNRAAMELGVYLSKLDTLERLFEAWATHDKVPLAKWIEYAGTIASSTGSPGAGGENHFDVCLCASPMTAAQILSRDLWKTVSAAVCTSATLTACGSFDFFNRLSGMNRFPERRSLVVSSPFNYATQGELRIAAMQNSPKSAGFSAELCQKLPELLSEHHHGQLVLFTSKRQMQACHAALPKDLLLQVLVQGECSRSILLKEHSRRVTSGERSIIFGLQSFGEGIDLPGELCEHVLIDKLPFTPPTSPVEEALAEWLNTQGRDPFYEISVPRAAIKLAQWVGRGIRTVTDKAVITVCDIRLGSMGYGKQILAGLPSFPVIRTPITKKMDSEIAVLH